MVLLKVLPLEVNGGAASSPTEVIVFGVLALAIVVIGLLLFRSLRKIDVPYAADLQPDGAEPGPAEQATPGEGDAPEQGSGSDGTDRPGTPENRPQGS